MHLLVRYLNNLQNTRYNDKDSILGFKIGLRNLTDMRGGHGVRHMLNSSKILVTDQLNAPIIVL